MGERLEPIPWQGPGENMQKLNDVIERTREQVQRAFGIQELTERQRRDALLTQILMENI